MSSTLNEGVFMLRSLALPATLALSLVTVVSPAEPAGPASLLIFGDTGYIPAYEGLDDDEPVLAALGDYLAAEAADWLERNPSLEGFVPTPWTFESSVGSYMAASGLYPVSRAMQELCATQPCDFAVMLGDNIYPDGATLGDDGIDDARRFTDMLARPFGQLGQGREDFTIYAMLGNHDWRHSRAGAEAQVAYLQQHPRFSMPGFFYRAVPPRFEGLVELFVIDTEMLLASTTVRKDALDADGNELDTGELELWPDHVRPQTAAEQDMVAWLQAALAESTARWKIVLGHHALWSGGGSKYEKARALRELLMPALCAHADAYIAGDDHVLEVYTDDCPAAGAPGRPPLPLLVAGAGSKYRSLHPAFMAQQLRSYPQLRNLWSKGSTWGFMHAQLEEDQLQLQVFTTPAEGSGRPVHEASFSFPRRSQAR